MKMFQSMRSLIVVACAVVAAIAMQSHRANAQCGVGWSLGSGNGPGGYQICYDEYRQRTVLFEGTTTYEWDGVSWTTVATSGPPERGAAAMVYDPATHQCLLFGGYSSSGPRKDLWSWDGTTWTQRASAPSEASGRGDFAMAFDRTRSRLVIHGGYPGSGSLLTDTLEWNPSANTWQRWATSPIGFRYAHRMAFDEARNEIILHGGYYFGNKNDTWRWNGAAWTLVSQTGPARYVFGMTYDSRRSQLILHGGTTCCGEVEYATTYTWNGTSWSLCTLQGPARGYMNIAYDRVRDVIVLPGGIGPTKTGRAYIPETWELALSIPSTTRRVPADYATIQAAVDAAVAGDTVLVSPGSYGESVNLRGKAILVKSEVIDGAIVLAPKNQRSFIASSNETSLTRVIGFRISPGSKSGGGVYTNGSSPVFDTCTFDRCKNDTGGGALVQGGAPKFIACDFDSCVATAIVGYTYGSGGAIRSVGGALTVEKSSFLNCVGNSNAQSMMQEGGSSVFRECAFVTNVVGGSTQVYNASGTMVIEDSLFDGMSGSACVFGWSPFTVRRCQFRNIVGSRVLEMRYGTSIIDTCKLEHCVTTGALFGVVYSGTYSVSNTSICDSSTPVFQGGWTDLGGNNFSANCSCFGDIDGGGSVGGSDLAYLLANWQSGPGTGPGDLSGDGEIDVVDLALLLANWGSCQ